MTALTRSELLALPATVDIPTAAQALSIGRTLAYQLARTGQFPVPVLRLGSRYRIVTSGLLAALGIAPAGTGLCVAQSEAAPSGSAPSGGRAP